MYPTVSGFTATPAGDKIKISWNSEWDQPDCVSKLEYEVTVQMGKELLAFGTTEDCFFEFTSQKDGSLTISIVSIVYVGGSELRSQTSRDVCDVCHPSEPTVSNIECVSCRTFTTETGSYLVSHQTPLVLSFDVKNHGVNCNRNSYAVDAMVDDTIIQVTEKLSHYELKFNYGFDASALSEQTMGNLLSLSLFVDGYRQTEVPQIVKCVVPSVVKNPRITSNRVSYYNAAATTSRDASESDVVPITFTGVDNLYSPCFGANAKYVFRYHTAGNDATTDIDMEQEISGTSSATVFTYGFNIGNSTYLPAVYIYNVVAVDVLGNEYKSSEGTIHKCSGTTDVPAPAPASPENNASGQTVKNLEFRWNQLSEEAMALKCDADERAQLILELEEEDEYVPSLGPQTSVHSVELTESSISLKNVLLKLSTRYYWRLTIVYEKNGAFSEQRSSNVFRFSTAAKHCAYMDCHNGECDEAATVCRCHSGYRGEYCDKSGLSSGVITGVVVGVLFLLAVFLLVAFYLLRKANALGLRMPDFTKYMFVAPKCVTDTEQRVPANVVEEAIARDSSENFAFAIALLRSTNVTETDNVCCGVVYAYERLGQALPLLVRLIEYEVAAANDEGVLFRSNSFASKCFKVYARMIGLPYLYHVVSPLLSDLVKNNQRADAGIRIEGDKSVLDGVQTGATQSYELDTENMGSADGDTGFVEANAISIQIACQTFLKTLARTKRYCPAEFRVVCKAIDGNASAKFGPQCVQHAISAFLFLRYFVAALAVPESFGLLKDVPSPTLRRQCILIAKVLSNLSTGIRFGKKEEYMTIMNDYLVSNEGALAPYYEFMVAADAAPSAAVDIPQRIYAASIELLSSFAARLDEQTKN